MKWKQKGYLTVEAAAIISITVIVVGMMVTMLLQVYGICSYTHMACESVLFGSSFESMETGDVIENTKERWEELCNGQGYGLEGIKKEISGNVQKVAVSVQREDINILVEQKLVRPVPFLRKICLMF